MQRSLNGIIGVVGRFLFAPTDPTTLGFIRIMTGVLLLYTTFAYSFDLKWLLGPDAWHSQESVNQIRRESPYIIYPIGWDNFDPVLRLEEAPHRRGAVLDFLRNLPGPVEERKLKLRFLVKVVGRSHEEQQASFFLPNSTAKLATDAEFNQVTKALGSTNSKMMDSPVTFPPFVWKMPIEERLEFWQDIRTFTDLLPTDAAQQEYVLAWLSYYPFENRKDLVRYLGGDYIDQYGRDMGLPADLNVRKEMIRYMDFWGVDPRQHPMKSVSIFSPFFHVKNLSSIWAIHIGIMITIALFTLGLFTRVTSVLVYIGSLAYIHRSPYHMFGQDTMQTILLFYLMIAPSGAALSLDALWKRYRASKALLNADGKSVPWAEQALSGTRSSWMANFSIRLLQMHFGVIYLASGLSKLKGSAWWNHNAAWMTLANPDFGLTRYPLFENFLHELADHRLLTMLVCGFVVFFTIGLEIGFIFLVWTRARPFMVIWALLFHLSIVIFMGLSVFGMYMFTMLLCYFPAKLIRERVGYATGVGSPLTIRFNRSDIENRNRVAWIHALDVANQVRWIEDQKSNQLTLVEGSGPINSGKSDFGRALFQLVLVKPFGFLLRPFIA